MEETLQNAVPRNREKQAFGGVDIPMLLIATALILFGCVMVYSASSVYAEQYHNDRSYFIVRQDRKSVV